MDKTKARLAAFFDNGDDEAPPQARAVDVQKLNSFAQGTARKSKREKEKEAADAKQREEEEHAAKAYAEFLDDFDGRESGGRKAAGMSFVKSASQSAYTPRAAMPTQPRASRPVERLPSPEVEVHKPRGKRAMDAFLEEIKQNERDREARFGRSGNGKSVTAMAAYESQSGSRDRGDADSTNLFVSNLPPTVTEQALGLHFARCGPVGSVKIMWPRSDMASQDPMDRRSKTTGFSGFVCFMRRKDAEKALHDLDGVDWAGSSLRVGWSKAVPVAAKPLYGSFKRSRSRSPQRHRGHSPPRGPRADRRSRSRSRSPRHRRRDRSPSSPHGHAAMEEEGETVTDTFIRAVAAEIKGHDQTFERNLKDRERDNPRYAFVFDKMHPRHAFYRGLLERHNDTDLAFEDDGNASAYSTDSGEESERERVRKTALGKLARRRFETMLRGLTGKRGELARCMAFSLEHAEAAHEVADIIIASLLVDGTAVPRKVARLHLICDILHNSAASVPSAWKFRLEFQSRLGIVFDHLATIYHSFPGRITADIFKKQITSVVDIWEDWIVFPPEFTAALRERLDGSRVGADEDKELLSAALPEDKTTSRFKASGFKKAAVSTSHIGDLTLATTPVNAHDLDGQPMDEEDLDGAPMLDDVDGVSMSGVDEDLDGEPMDDLDGEPMA